MVIRVKEKQRFNSSRAEAITKAPAHISPNKKNFLADKNFFSPNGIIFSPEEKKLNLLILLPCCHKSLETHLFKGFFKRGSNMAAWQQKAKNAIFQT